MVAGIVDEDMRSEVDDDTVSYPGGGNGDRSNSVKFKGSQLWNRLPHYLVEITSPASFRKSLKHYLTYNPM